MKLSHMGFFAALLIAGTTPAWSANLITNGGFETGDFTGWTLADTDNETMVEKAPFNDYAPHGGQYFAALAGDQNHSYLSQTITDTPGQQLLLNFYIESDGLQANNLDFEFGATDYSFGGIDSTGGTYDLYSFVTTGSGSDTLTFDSVDFRTWIALDDVSITPISAPEPSIWAMMLVGFGLVGTALRRRGDWGLAI